MHKKRRFSQDATRTALLEAGKQLLVDRGLDTGLGRVTLNDAVVQSGVARASAYRVFTKEDIDPQVAFRTELLISYINEDPLETRRPAAERIAADAMEAVRTDDPAEQAAALREAIRVGYAGTIAGLADDPNWQVVGPSWAATAFNEWAPEELMEAHRVGAIKNSQHFLPLYQQVSVACGLRIRAEFSWEVFALMAQSAAITGSFHRRYHPHLGATMRPTGPNGALQPWSHAAVLVEGLVLTAFEPDPDAALSADLSTWIA